MKRIKKETTDVLKHREDSYKIDPLLIKVDFNDKNGNPRRDYEISPEKWKNFKESIKQEGVKVSLKLFKDEEGNWNLAHGFRRLKAVLELIQEGHAIELVPFEEVAKNEEQIMADHFVLNNGEQLNDFELADGLKRLKVMMGGDVSDISVSRRVNIEYQKVHNLLSFSEKACTQIKNAGRRGEVSFAVASEIVKRAKNSAEQVSLLKQGKETKEQTGSNKIRTKHISRLNSIKIPFNVKLKMTLDNALKEKYADKGIIKLFKQIVEAVENQIPIENIANLLKKPEFA